MKLSSIRAITRGAALAARRPQLLTRLPRILSREREESCWESEVRRNLGGVPRTVPIERLIEPSEARLQTVSFLDDTSPILDLILLRSLVVRRPGASFFEVGTFRGESAAAVADVAGSVTTLSLPDDDLAKLGANESFIAAHRVFSQEDSRIRHLMGDSRSMDLSEFTKSIDVLFIDGDHRRDGVESDTRRFWPLRRDERSVVVWHDAFLTPLRPRWEVLAGIAAGLAPEFRGGLVHVSNTLCVAWLPDAAELPTVSDSYVPRLAFTVNVGIRQGWQNPKTHSGTAQARAAS
jgi:predicted O-methyltransferase YrrM